jgi:putative Holliday junction resolvase
VLAFDFGERFIGVAVGDSQTRLAHPLVTIDARSKEARFEQLGALIEEWRPALLVVGHPFSIDGERHDLTERAERFARQLGGRFRLPIRLIDERLTSAEAQRELSAAGRGGRADKSLSHAVAARIILESHFDERTA